MKVEIRDCALGLGVFATQDIQRGTDVDMGYGLWVENVCVPEHSLLEPYVFASDIYGLSIVATGNVSFYNHSDNPNACYETEDQYDICDRPKVFIKALRDIKKDEEIFIDYGYEPIDNGVAVHEEDTNESSDTTST